MIFVLFFSLFRDLKERKKSANFSLKMHKRHKHHKEVREKKVKCPPMANGSFVCDVVFVSCDDCLCGFVFRSFVHSFIRSVDFFHAINT